MYMYTDTQADIVMHCISNVAWKSLVCIFKFWLLVSIGTARFPYHEFNQKIFCGLFAYLLHFFLIAPSSLRFEPVGRWYQANIHRRQHGLSSHHSSSSASSAASSEGGYSSDEEDHRFLLTLDPTDWKVKCYDWLCIETLLYLKHFLDKSVQGRKVQTGYTALIKAPTHEMQNTEPRPDHNTGNSMPYSFRWVCGVL